MKFINKEYKTTILLTTHDIGDIEEICERLILIDSGKVFYDGRVDYILDTYGRFRKIHVRTEDFVDISKLYNQINGSNISIEGTSDREFSISFDSTKISMKEVLDGTMRVVDIIDMQTEQTGIEHILKQVYEGTLNLGKEEDN